MSLFSLRLKVDNNKKAFQPGEEISGEAIIENLGDWEVDYAELMLFWRTEGKGDEDHEVVALDRLAPKGYRAVPGDAEHRFRFPLPEMPWTYHGRALKIHWVLGLYAKPKGGPEQSLEYAFALHPTPKKFSEL